MPAFRYQAVNAKGKVVKGTQEGDTERQVRTLLRQKQLKPISVKKVLAGSQVAGNGDRVTNQRLAVKDLSLFTRQLASLVQSGMPLAESLEAVAKQTRKDRVKDIISHVRSRVLEGLSLAQALADYPKAFDSMYRAMVNAGEQAGFLGPVLERLSEYAETSHATGQRLKSAMVYPLVLMLVCIAIVVLLMVYVVPQLTSVFARGKQALPWSTELLIGISEFIQSYGLVCFGIVGLLFLMFRWWLRDEKHQYLWHGLQLKLPLISSFVIQTDSSRFAGTLSMLINSGVPLLSSLRISNQTMGNRVLCEKAEEAAVAVEEGASLYKALDRTEIFPPLMVQMAGSGEANGTLAEQLDYSAKSQQRELDLQLSTILGLIEPVAIVVMGCVIGFIMFGIITPIVGMSDLIN